MLKPINTPQSIPSLGFNTLSPEMAKATNYPKWIARYFSQWICGKTLEVGIGFANYRRHYCCDQYIGADIDQDVVAMATQLYPQDKFFVADMAGTDFVAKALAHIGQGQFDCVLSFNALQYVEDERLAIRNLLSAVKPGGHVCLLVPAFESLYGAMDLDSGHRYRYDKTKLLGFVDSKQGEVELIRYFNSIAGIGWGVSNLLRGDKLAGTLDNDGNTAIEIFDKYFLPISKLAQPLTQYVFGLSHALVIRRLG